MRYLAQRQLGADHHSALATVASSYGLSTNVVRLTTDGNRTSTMLRWTVAEMSAVIFLRWERETGRIGGPEN